VFTHTVGGRGVAEGPAFGVVNPATGQVFAQCPDASKALLDEAVYAARQAAPAWAAAGFGARRQALVAFGAAIAQHAPQIAALLTLEQGKPYANALAEVQRTALTIERVTSIPLGTEVLREDAAGRVELHYRPLGVAAAITPWNVPIGLAMGKIVHALYTGNTLVLKPSPYTPLSTLKLGEAARGVLPAGVLNVLAGGNDLGRWMSEHPGIDKVSFTGSGPTGRRVMASAAGNLKRVTLELGGNDAAIVLPGSDIAALAPRLFAASFANSGQICMAIKRLYVHASQHEALCTHMARLASASVVGDGFQDGVQMGPVQNRVQYDIVRGPAGRYPRRGRPVPVRRAGAGPPRLLHRSHGGHGCGGRQPRGAGRALWPVAARAGIRRYRRGRGPGQRNRFRPERLRLGPGRGRRRRRGCPA
jgi:acyl-CoA reductase-like NAD-dependent aldehyde dehydrogenase